MKLTINEIAEMAQVAKSTVSKALNGQKGVSEENRRRILNIVQQVNYQPNSAARALAQNRTDTIGIVLPYEASYSLSGLYWIELIAAVAEMVTKHGNNLMIITPAKEELNPFASLDSLVRRHIVDGLIIGAEQLDTKTVMSIMLAEIPFVLIGRNEVIQHYCVDVNNKNGGFLITEQLIQHSYKHIACIAGPKDYLYTQERIAGFTEALEKNNMKPEHIIYTSYYREDAQSNAAKLIEEHPDIDALFITAGGEFVLNILDTLRFSGYSPNKMGIGVFDDNRIFDFLDFPIITAKQPLKDMGQKATSILFDIIEGKLPSEKIQFFPVDIILR
jgi:LacI family transcriptional regulator